MAGSRDPGQFSAEINTDGSELLVGRKNRLARGHEATEFAWTIIFDERQSQFVAPGPLQGLRRGRDPGFTRSVKRAFGLGLRTGGVIVRLTEPRQTQLSSSGRRPIAPVPTAAGP